MEGEGGEVKDRNRWRGKEEADGEEQEGGRKTGGKKREKEEKFRRRWRGEEGR